MSRTISRNPWSHSRLIALAGLVLLAHGALFAADDTFSTGVLEFATANQRLDAPNGSPASGKLSITLIDKDTAQHTGLWGINEVLSAGIPGVGRDKTRV